METQTHSIKTIGGYIGLQLNDGEIYYPNLIALNTGRNALEYILRIRKYKTIYLPYFTCDVLLEPLKKLNLTYKFYSLDENLNPIIDFILDAHSCLLYTNYFGVKTDVVMYLSGKINNLIIDNAQAFFTRPIGNLDTFYSCRKFFGVPDGAYLNIETNHKLNLQRDESIDRFSHLIKSIDINIENGYPDYIENNNMLVNNDIKTMSQLTQSILAGTNYERCMAARKSNFAYLNKHFAEINLLPFNYSSLDVPMVYPLLINDRNLKKKLIEHKIFIATYWPNVYRWAAPDSYEYFLTENLIALPIDHRYELTDMKTIVSIIKSLL